MFEKKPAGYRDSVPEVKKEKEYPYPTQPPLPRDSSKEARTEEYKKRIHALKEECKDDNDEFNKRSGQLL
ncbi:MAG: hypothetical protein WC878_05675 [Candidatus Paceibacterota bacterium]|jgi:hypothetical protein